MGGSIAVQRYSGTAVQKAERAHMKSKIALLVVIAVAIGAFFFFDLGRFLSLDAFKAQQATLAAYVAENPWQSALAFFAAYVAVAALS